MVSNVARLWYAGCIVSSLSSNRTSPASVRLASLRKLKNVHFDAVVEMASDKDEMEVKISLMVENLDKIAAGV